MFKQTCCLVGCWQTKLPPACCSDWVNISCKLCRNSNKRENSLNNHIENYHWYFLPSVWVNMLFGRMLSDKTSSCLLLWLRITCEICQNSNRRENCLKNHVTNYHTGFPKSLNKHVVWYDAGRRDFFLLVALIATQTPCLRLPPATQRQLQMLLADCNHATYFLLLNHQTIPLPS